MRRSPDEPIELVRPDYTVDRVIDAVVLVYLVLGSFLTAYKAWKGGKRP